MCRIFSKKSCTTIVIIINNNNYNYIISKTRSCYPLDFTNVNNKRF